MPAQDTLKQHARMRANMLSYCRPTYCLKHPLFTMLHPPSFTLTHPTLALALRPCQTAVISLGLVVPPLRQKPAPVMATAA